MSNTPSQRPRWLLAILESEYAFKALAFFYWLLLFGAVFGLFKVLTDDPQHFRDFGVLVAVVTVFFAGLCAHVTLRRLGANKPLYENDRRSKVLLLGGFGAAFLLALALSIYNHIGTASQNRGQDNARAQREMLGRFGK